MSYLRLYTGGTYHVVDATGVLVTLPTNTEAVWVDNDDSVDVWVHCEKGITLASCVVPVSTGDPCSARLRPSGYLIVKPNGATKIALKTASGTAKVVITPCEET